MSKYRQIKSIAHNFSHSFTSMMNWEDGDYIMDCFISSMAANEIDQAKLDILKARIEPESINTAKIMSSIQSYCYHIFPNLLRKHGVPENYIKKATMILTFHLSEIDDQGGDGNSIFVPYDCITEIIDDRGRRHVGKIHDSEVINRERVFA